MPRSPYALAAIRRGARTGRASSWATDGRNGDRWTIEPGATAVLADIQGPGVLTHLWMTQSIGYRDCLLKITWDDAKHPSVLCPLGDFFGLGHAMVNNYQSLLFTASTKCANQYEQGVALNCYVPMPFRKRALVELVNEGTRKQSQYFYVDYETFPNEADLADLGYFHAEFRRAFPFGGWGPQIMVNTPPADVPNLAKQAWEHNYVILDTKGTGHYIGCNLSVTNFQGSWWGEGDDMIWVDGYKWPPDLHGTGSEDYLNQAWGMQPHAFLRNGSSLHESLTGGYQTSFVHHLENPVRFSKEIKVTIEHGHANHLANEMSSVAYWYADKPTRIAAPPSVAKRQRVEKNADGSWNLSKRVTCPGQPVKLTAAMKKAKAQWKDDYQEQYQGVMTPRVGRDFSPYCLKWRMSSVLPHQGSVADAPYLAPAEHPDWAAIALVGGVPNMCCINEHVQGNGLVYLANRFNVPRAGQWRMYVGHDGGVRVFLNGQEALCVPETRNPAYWSRSHADLTLAKGPCEIVIAFDKVDRRGWGFFFCFQDLSQGAKTGRAQFPVPM
jgi:ribosomal protein L24E